MIGNQINYTIQDTWAHRFDYVFPHDPTYDLNPPLPNAVALNTVTGEIFHCIDNTRGLSIWIGTLSTIVSPYYFNEPVGIKEASLNYIFANDSVKSVSYSPSTGIIYTTETSSNTKYMWRYLYETGERLSNTPTYTNYIYKMGADPYYKKLATADTSHQVHLYDEDTMSIEGSFDMGAEVTGCTMYNGNLIWMKTLQTYIGTVYICSGFSSTVTKSFSTGTLGATPTNLAIYNDLLMISAGSSGIYLFSMSGEQLLHVSYSGISYSDSTATAINNNILVVGQAAYQDYTQDILKYVTHYYYDSGHTQEIT